MKKLLTAVSITTLLLITIIGCNKKDNFSSEELSSYMNLEVGKYIRYRLDSTEYINFGQKDTVIKYQAKDVIDAAITDNLGRPGWRVVRYLRDTASTNEADWTPAATFMLIPTRETVEWVDNNFRFQILKLPITEGFNWKGNAYVSPFSSDPNWEFRYLDDWDYTYEDINSSFTVWDGVNVDNTITVNQRDEIIGIPSDINAYSERNYSKEVYGKGIGLVFRDFIHWEYQPPNGGNPGYTNGYGIKLVMIDHN